MTAGFFGKIPARGDFVRGGLSDAFVVPWDDWIQRGMLAARAEGTAGRFEWAPHHLAVRFAVDGGWLGPEAWCGVFSTSADRVGRPFPLVVARSLHAMPTGVDEALAMDTDLDRFATALALGQRSTRLEPFIESIADLACQHELRVASAHDHGRARVAAAITAAVGVASSREPRLVWWVGSGDDLDSGVASLPPDARVLLAMLGGAAVANPRA